MKVVVENNKVKVQSKYDVTFARKSRELGGEWEKPYWVFDSEKEEEVRALCMKIYGEDGTEEIEPCEVDETKIQKVIDEYVYEEKFSKKAYFQQAKRWTKEEKDRLYIPRDAYEQAGYIDLKTLECHPNRPGNLSQLQGALEILKEK